MIDEKKLIEEIQRQINIEHKKCNEFVALNVGDLVEKYNHGEYCYVNVLHLVQSQPKVGEWIPCSERLPERDRPFQTGGYLVTAQFVKDGKTGKEFTSQASFDYENKRWLVRDCEVLAWCELPEPYNADMRGGKNEDNI